MVAGATNPAEPRSAFRIKPTDLVAGVAVFAGLYLASRYNYLLFHSIAEIFSIIVAAGIFMLTWNARRFTDDAFFPFLGLACLFAGILLFFHTLGYKGMGVFAGRDANLATQLWIAKSILLAASLFAASWLPGRRLNLGASVAGFSLIVSLLLASIFVWDIFPDCFRTGTGLTPFKIGSEYAICAVLLASIAVLLRKRAFFDGRVLRLTIGSIALVIASELSFTLYTDVYGLSNAFGHFLEIASFYLLYKAVVETGLVKPFDLLFRSLKASEEEARTAKDRLEVRVAERTAELADRNTRLWESERQFRSLVENLPLGLLIVQDGTVVFGNPEATRIFGVVPGRLAAVDLSRIHAEDGAKLARFCRDAVRPQEPPSDVDVRFLPRDPEIDRERTRWVRFHADRIDFRGQDALLVVLVDVICAKEMEQLLAVRERLASLGQLSAGIAHEIRNPLSGMNIYLSAIEQACRRSEGIETEHREKISAIVEQMKGASNKIASVVNRVMEFAKPSPARMEPVVLNPAIEEAVRLAAAALRKQGIDVSLSLSPDLPPCHADPRLVEQVLVNLVGNAVQAMANRDGPRRLEITSAAEHDRVVIRVSDSGPGVPPELRRRVFDPFFTTKKDGYGIGLSFCHRVVSEHRGTITAGASRLGGAEFRVELPLDRDRVRA